MVLRVNFVEDTYFYQNNFTLSESSFARFKTNDLFLTKLVS